METWLGMRSVGEVWPKLPRPNPKILIPKVPIRKQVDMVAEPGSRAELGDDATGGGDVKFNDNKIPTPANPRLSNLPSSEDIWVCPIEAGDGKWDADALFLAALCGS